MTVSKQDVQEIVEKYSCTVTATIMIHKGGTAEIKEYVDTGRIVGEEYTDDEYHKPCRIDIFYSKKGTHIFPT